MITGYTIYFDDENEISFKNVSEKLRLSGQFQSHIYQKGSTVLPQGTTLVISTSIKSATKRVACEIYREPTGPGLPSL